MRALIKALLAFPLPSRPKGSEIPGIREIGDILSRSSQEGRVSDKDFLIMLRIFIGLTFNDATLKSLVASVSFSPDGACLFAGTKHGSISSWNLVGDTGWKMPVFEPHGYVRSIVFSSDGEHITTVHEDNIVLISDNTGKKIGKSLVHEAPVSSVVFSADGRFIVTASSDIIYIWDAVNLETKAHRQHSGLIMSVTVSPDVTHVASASDDKTIQISDIQQLQSTNPIQHKLEGHTEAVICVQYSPDGMRLISGSTDCTIRLWDTTTGETIMVISTQNRPVRCLAVSLSGHLIASGSDEGYIQVWNANTGKRSEVIDYGVSIGAIAFAPNGRQLASGYNDGAVRVWELL
ncbi:quinon protein alcohol dehydrogenase-like superfamily [Rhodocollybia butyracea]|uniref:Quinon protein alcohol dehydrogenase-like superfamily n=1 Tax=Rhodocollybia butyracea TaxID=206335 RepID=A0A9P5U4I2_9AGAR|nr:quinon protein alcohol dehydrogenase-like superfamily [Rhodocollybia butyracea]